jgi:hypothetical protein
MSAARIKATARYLAERGLDGLLAFNNGQNSFLESNAVFVLSGVRPIGEGAVLVDRGGGASSLRRPGTRRGWRRCLVTPKRPARTIWRARS